MWGREPVVQGGGNIWRHAEQRTKRGTLGMEHGNVTRAGRINWRVTMPDASHVNVNEQ
jgi:hypothetical protein